MRKRIVIAAIAAVVIGVVAYVGAYRLSEPPQGSAEWHKRQYLEAKKQVARGFRALGADSKPGFIERVKARFHKLTKTPYRRTTRTGLEAIGQQMESWNALCRLGYLRRETLFVQHQQNFRILPLVEEAARKELPSKSIWTISVANGPENALVVWASADGMAKLEALIRKADVPETK